jgi:hypothetical protein
MQLKPTEYEQNRKDKLTRTMDVDENAEEDK